MRNPALPGGMPCSTTPQGMASTAPGTDEHILYFRVVTKWMRWHGTCSISGMKLTQPILTTISRELCHGNPWWALVVANEYLEPTSPLHTALVKLFQGRVGEDSDLTRRIRSGARYVELSAAERDRVGSRGTLHRPPIPTIPRDHKERQRARGRRPPVRRALRSAPPRGAPIHREPTHRVSKSLTSTISLSAPALRVVQGVARRSS
jgi:hypothetical protein